MSGELPPVPMVWTGNPHFWTFFLLLLQHCTLASSTTLLQSFWSLATVYQFPIPIPVRSSSALPVHLYCGLPLFLIPSFLVVSVYFGTFFTFTSCKREGNMVTENKNCARTPLGTLTAEDGLCWV